MHDHLMADVAPEEEDVVASAGVPLAEGAAVADEAPLIEALKTVHDPEIPVNIYDLGLIYRLDIATNGDVAIDMSLTAPGCPVAGEMPHQVAHAVADVPGTGVVTVRLVWDPPWTQDRMSEVAQMALGMW